MREAVLGGLLGLVTGGLSVWSLWLITGFAARASQGLRVDPADDDERLTNWDPIPDDAADEPRSPVARWLAARQSTRDDRSVASHAATGGGESLGGATLRVFFAFLLKAPILVAIAFLAQSLGARALYWCVGGVVLVYFLAVFWAAGQTNRR